MGSAEPEVAIPPPQAPAERQTSGLSMLASAPPGLSPSIIAVQVLYQEAYHPLSSWLRHPARYRDRIPESVSRGIQHPGRVVGLFLHISCGPAASCLLDVAVRNQIGQGALDGSQADIRAGLGDFLLGDLSGCALDDGLDSLRF